MKVPVEVVVAATTSTGTFMIGKARSGLTISGEAGGRGRAVSTVILTVRNVLAA
jgi:hypothetical protein